MASQRKSFDIYFNYTCNLFMPLIWGSCCEKLPAGIPYPAPLEAHGLTIIIRNSWRYYFISVCVFIDCRRCAVNVCQAARAIKGLVSQPPCTLTPALPACLILRECKVKCKWVQDQCLSANAASLSLNPVLQSKTSLPNLLTWQVG